MRGRAVSFVVVVCACSDAPAPRATTTNTGGGNADGGARVVPQPGRTYAEVPLERYCEVRAEVECHRLEVCGPTVLASVHGDLATCTREKTAVCEGAFLEKTAAFLIEKGFVTYDAARMGAALTEFSRRHCNTRQAIPSPATATRGALADGTRCVDHDVCLSGFCRDVRPFSCGTCAPRPATPPSECPTSCPLHQRCQCTPRDDAGVRSCACADALPEGADCKSNRAACDEGLGCLDVADSADNVRTVCRSFPVEGEACGAGAGFVECVGEATCQPASGGKSACKKPALSSPGVQCDEPRRLCPRGYDCRGSCVARASRGESCIPRSTRTVPDGGPPTCAEGFCQGNCIAPGGMGSQCVDALDCTGDTGCYLFGVGFGSCDTWDNVKTRTEQLFTCR